MYCKKINNEKVEPIKLPDEMSKPLKGHELFDIPYANIYLVAKKKSGKTCSIMKCLDKLCGKNTQIIVFCSTFYNDASWIAIKKHFEQKKINLIAYTSIYENGLNQINELVKTLTDEAKMAAEEVENPLSTEIVCYGRSIINDKIKAEMTKKKKKKNDAADFILVVDDLSNELKDKAFAPLLKANRHFKMFNIISSQYYTDLEKAGRMNIDYILIWPGQPVDKLKSILLESNMSIDYDKFKEMYDIATSKKYHFLYCNIRTEEFRICFDKQFILEDLNKNIKE